jgi:hypothetical protein
MNSDEPAGNVYPIDDQGDGRWRPGQGAPRRVLWAVRRGERPR